MPQFSLFSLNSFGLPFYIAHRRLPLLIQELQQLPSAMVCLQEVQQNAYLALFRQGLARHAHHAFHPNRFAPMGGLFTASRLPLENSDFALYQNRGHWFSPALGDRLLHKGVLSTQVRVNGQLIVVLNTHLNANYSGNWSPRNYFARILRDQVEQLAAWVHAQPAEAVVIVCGDFNFPRQSFLYELLLERSGLTDPLACDPRPTYRPFPLVPRKWALPIDFVLVRLPAHLPLTVQADIVPIENSAAVHARHRFLTDHCALTLELGWEP